MDNSIKGHEEIKESLNELKTMIKDIRRDFKGLIEIQQRLIHERLNVPMPNPPVEYGEESAVVSKKKNEGIVISDFSDGRIKITGNTFNYRDTIKSIGGSKWEANTKVWSVPSSELEDLVTKLESLKLTNGKDFTVDVTVSNAVSNDVSDNSDTFGNNL